MVQVLSLEPVAQDDIVGVLCDAFADYPVMRDVIGESGQYERDLRTLISFFVGCRVLRADPLFGVRGPDGLVAAAIVSRPEVPSPASVTELREETWTRLGEEARARYTEFGEATAGFDVDEPHIHLNMIGAASSARGKGFGRTLLEAVHAYSAGDPTSCGVSLTTEASANVSLYEYFGYEVVGEARIREAFTSWGLYRRDA